MLDQDLQKDHMERMYRWTRHVYDASRKFYLLGRDQMITGLKCKQDENICEIGCGTARNLIKIAQLYPQANLFGLDISEEMLKTADKSISKTNLGGKITLRQGYAENFKAQDLVDLDKSLDKIIFSYALSIIPPWKESIDHALDSLPEGGEIHIVDFGGMEGLPKWFQGLLSWWLSLFKVRYKPEVLEYLKTLVTDKKGTLNLHSIYNGYAYIAIFRKT